jgi:octaprenyl-diphosphate synthase
MINTEPSKFEIDQNTVSRKSLSDVTSPVADSLSEFNRYFKDTIRTDVFLLDQIVRYLLKQKGKQLRPTLVFMSARLFGEINQRSFIAATMIELLHTATLIHDDVVDEAESRRGFLSINKLWKNKAGVLLGDYLLAKGLLIALDNEEYKLLQVLSNAVKSMSEGELRQLKTAKLFNMTEERYFQIISEKTASLIAACCECGAVAVSDDEVQHARMKEIGRCIGIAFQIRDDIFDYGLYDIGKPKRNDIQERKVTLPLIKAFEHASSSEERKIRSLMKKRKKSSAEVEEIVQFVNDKGGMDAARSMMYEYANKAMRELEQVPDTEDREQFIELIQFIITRKK